MITGVGTDMIEVSRIRQCLGRRPRFEDRILTPSEKEICYSGGNPAQRVAGRFAAKEAVAKALGASLGWHDVEILADCAGRPGVRLLNGAASLAAGRTVMVSISHCRSYAVAHAVAVLD